MYHLCILEWAHLQSREPDVFIIRLVHETSPPDGLSALSLLQRELRCSSCYHDNKQAACSPVNLETTGIIVSMGRKVESDYYSWTQKVLCSHLKPLETILTLRVVYRSYFSALTATASVGVAGASLQLYHRPANHHIQTTNHSSTLQHASVQHVL